jgi:signal transduction histidine kinase
MNVLIVDDHASSRKLLCAALESEGHSASEAANGKEALDVLERESIDAVISDILMPTMDGFRLCHEIRTSAHAHSGVPLILYTATYDSPADRQLADAVGADCYILKPASTHVILAALSEAHQKARQRTTGSTPRVDELFVLEEYNAELVRKLEVRNSELKQALCSLRDAHEHILELNRSLETRVAQRTATLDAANKELEAFSYSVSHDLRAPLRHIDGFARLLQESAGGQMNVESRGFLRQIVSATEQMDRLIRDLLEFARTSALEPDRADVDLEKLLDEALAAVQPDTLGRSIQWERSHLPKVRGDAPLLRQVLVNLVSNALKFTRMRNPAVIEIGSRTGRADEVVVFVRDNGVGFDPHRVGELFRVFRRLHSATEFEGTGVGLANAHRIITRHGGAIWAEAAVDRGATFYFSLAGCERAQMGFIAA